MFKLNCESSYNPNPNFRFTDFQPKYQLIKKNDIPKNISSSSFIKKKIKCVYGLDYRLFFNRGEMTKKEIFSPLEKYFKWNWADTWVDIETVYVEKSELDLPKEIIVYKESFETGLIYLKDLKNDNYIELCDCL